MELLSAKNVSYSYDKKTMAVKGVSLSVNQGDYIAIIGHNGSGKSTLAKLFNGLLLPDEGSISVEGFCSSDKKALFEIRKRVGVVFQNPDNQLVASIIEDDVAFGPENLGLKREEIAKRIDFALSSVGMKEYAHRSPERLSGGQKQRVAIAGVLALMPKILVLDESTSMLDPRGRKEVLDVVEKLNKDGMAVIAITHYMDEVLKANKIVVMNDGEIIMTGTSKEIFAQKDQLIKYGLELPKASQLAEKLTKVGVKIENVLTDADLAEELCKL